MTAVGGGSCLKERGRRRRPSKCKGLGGCLLPVVIFPPAGPPPPGGTCFVGETTAVRFRRPFSVPWGL